MTAVEWLFETIWDCPKDKLTWYTILEKAKEMERLQLIDAQSYAISNADMTNNRGYFDCDKWYNETYGNNGNFAKGSEKQYLSQTNTSQTEISDVEELKLKHEQIRDILIKYGNEEHGDCIIDEICEVVGIPPTTIYYEE